MTSTPDTQGSTVVTGANRGIGLELVRRLSAAGRRVVATARRPEEAGELARLDVSVHALDVGSDESVARFAAALGEQPVDVLINNAGVYGQRAGLEELDVSELARVYDTNAVGTLRVTRALLRNLRAGSAKRVVNVTSKMGSIADNTSGGSYAYRASKAALNMFTVNLAHDLGPEGFVCLAVHPGWVQTRMGGAHAPLPVEECARRLLQLVEGLGPEQNGAFLDYAGQRVPW